MPTVDGRIGSRVSGQDNGVELLDSDGRTVEIVADGGDDAVEIRVNGKTILGLNSKATGYLPASAYTVTNFTARRNHSGTEATVANVAAALATLINDLIAAGVIRGTVA